MLHTRSKSVCIRVSAEERRILSEACERNRMRSISELAREAMHRIIEAKGFEPLASQDVQFWLRELACRLTTLQSEVERLQDVLAIEVGGNG
jgi:hypothetical protein